MSKIVNVYIVFDLDAWPRNATNNFKFKNCLFGATSTVKYSDKEKHVYSGYAIRSASAGSWSFDHDSVRNVIIFGADNSSSSLSDNKANYKNANFPTQFCLGSISNGFSATESRQASLHGMCMIFQSLTILSK